MNRTLVKQRVKDLKSFYTNCIWFGFVAVIILGRNFIKWMTTDYIFHGSIILTVWAIILLVKAVKLFILNSEWEQNAIKDEMINLRKQ
ncbi:2TM domain-containing protein [Chryseobacterium taihuense]|uniref:2TM domain-containing protein n=1 Tax=Chryseobacterium taihuense TaxID=1141221 RepID=A0ABY0QWK0_9FLAO|nr:2TM domain-containing protein [Chryseobacterium taihuense]SDM02604.1 2TM domain-containing protein [Chryseobacterium taihuense]